MSRETELAWAAGFWDGEGCATPKRSRQTGQIKGVVLIVSQKYDPACINRFYYAVGERGNLTDKIRRDGTNQGRVYVWSTARKEWVEEVMDMLMPYLSTPKIEQYQKLLIDVQGL